MPRFLTDKESAEVTSLLLRITSVSSLSKMSIRASNTEPKLDLTSSDNPGRIVSSPLLDEWTIILLHLALVTKSLSSPKKKCGSKDSTARFSAMNNLLDRLFWVGRKEVISRGEDRLSLLPESLLCHILSFLTTREAVCTSVLSSSWRNLWQWVPRLELDRSAFPNDKACVGFINKFLLNVKSLSEFNLTIDAQDASLYEPCLGNVSKRKIQQFHVECNRFNKTPLTFPACEELVTLKLFAVRLNDFESLSLPCLKTLHLAYVIFPDNAGFDTPRLEHLSLIDYLSNSFKIVGMPASVKVHIDVFLLDGELYNLLHKFLAVGDMTLSLATLELIYFFHDTNPRTEFTNLSRLRATMCLEYDCLRMLPFVLEMCPNLKHLTLELVKDVNTKKLATGRRKVRSFCLVSSLEYVEIESPITKEATEREVVKYFLGNVTSLKKLVLRLNVSRGEKHDLELLKQRFDSPRRSTLCQFEVLQKKEYPFGFELLHCGLSERKIIDNLLNKFLAVRDMTLSQNTLLLLYYLHDTYPRPEFRNLSRLRSTMCLQDSLELLPFVLESCPSLKNLTLILVKDDDPEAETTSLSKPLSFCLVHSLEYVEIEGPITEEATEQEVVKYILGNGRSLKKLVLRLNVSDGEKHDLELLKQRFDSPRRSSSCQFEVLLVVQTPEKIKCGNLFQSIRRTLSLFSPETVLDFLHIHMKGSCQYSLS